ncbi:hypothetical protein AB0878_48565 [Amycolatopsis sp. NPDC047767]|uniref:hypothetical protein n=1 Tax=Amycolatopsis sp. NPDC047767 TaxID=3156765 RepID=UPI00345356C2
MTRWPIPPAGWFGRERTQYLPVRPEVAVDAETDPTVEYSFTSRRLPRVHRRRLDLDANDVQPRSPMNSAQ